MGRLPPFVLMVTAEGVDAVVVRADIDGSIGHGGRTENPGAGGEAPQLRSGGSVQRVDIMVERADIHHAIGDGGRRVEIVAGSEVPDLGTSGGIEGIEIAVIRTDVDQAESNGRGRLYWSGSSVAPLQSAGCS